MIHEYYWSSGVRHFPCAFPNGASVQYLLVQRIIIRFIWVGHSSTTLFPIEQ